MAERAKWVDPDADERAVGLAMIEQNRAEARDMLRTCDSFIVAASKHHRPGVSDLTFFLAADGSGQFELEFYYETVKTLVEAAAASLEVPVSVAVTGLFQRLLTDVVLKDIPDAD